jgi:hypothetical protein
MESNKSLYAHPEIAVLLLLQNDPKSVDSTGTQTDQDSVLPDFGRIRCPCANGNPNHRTAGFCAPCDYPESFMTAAEPPEILSKQVVAVPAAGISGVGRRV